MAKIGINCCNICKKKGIIATEAGNWLCKDCFCRLVDRRVNKEIKKNLVHRGERIGIIGRSNEAIVLFEFLKPLAKAMDASVDWPAKPKKKYSKLYEPHCLEKVAASFLDNACRGRFITCEARKNPLRFITRQELSSYAKIKGLKQKKEKISKTESLLDRTEKKFPGTKFSIMGSIERLGL